MLLYCWYLPCITIRLPYRHRPSVPCWHPYCRPTRAWLLYLLAHPHLTDLACTWRRTRRTHTVQVHQGRRQVRRRAPSDNQTKLPAHHIAVFDVRCAAGCWRCIAACAGHRNRHHRCPVIRPHRHHPYRSVLSSTYHLDHPCCRALSLLYRRIIRTVPCPAPSGVAPYCIAGSCAAAAAAPLAVPVPVVTASGHHH